MPKCTFSFGICNHNTLLSLTQTLKNKIFNAVEVFQTKNNSLLENGKAKVFLLNFLFAKQICNKSKTDGKLVFVSCGGIDLSVKQMKVKKHLTVQEYRVPHKIGDSLHVFRRVCFFNRCMTIPNCKKVVTQHLRRLQKFVIGTKKLPRNTWVSRVMFLGFTFGKNTTTSIRHTE